MIVVNTEMLLYQTGNSLSISNNGTNYTPANQDIKNKWKRNKILTSVREFHIRRNTLIILNPSVSYFT